MNNFEGKDIISTKSMTRKETEKILKVAKSMETNLKTKKRSKLLEGKILANLFFEPSTRTYLSFESAMYRLGGDVMGFADPKGSRAYGPRAESLEDTVRTVERYCDVIVLRHFESGTAQKAADVARIPIINAGDGRNEHPSQGLLDTCTIWREKGKLDGLTVGIAGDMFKTRGMHSLLYCLSKFDMNLILVAPEELRISEEMRRHLQKGSANFEETTNLEKSIKDMDVLYTTRLNKEGAKSEKDYLKLLKAYPRITLDLIAKGKGDLIVMHDLPRTDELGFQISPELDKTPHAKYFDEVEYGLNVRMALLALVLGAVG